MISGTIRSVAQAMANSSHLLLGVDVPQRETEDPAGGDILEKAAQFAFGSLR